MLYYTTRSSRPRSLTEGIYLDCLYEGCRMFHAIRVGLPFYAHQCLSFVSRRQLRYSPFWTLSGKVVVTIILSCEYWQCHTISKSGVLAVCLIQAILAVLPMKDYIQTRHAETTSAHRSLMVRRVITYYICAEITPSARLWLGQSLAT